jgi:hypothetical protein
VINLCITICGVCFFFDALQEGYKSVGITVDFNPAPTLQAIILGLFT